ncbi:tyrosine-protein phosphatase 99A [Eurytemora carolleeae]|uniref:tyrosine-protein phosphatase 99A n=1 Tax=Eurytemora carolleeae TaxID=1294199 RepID=UPI000C75CE13|nr:tyrosine-protein phosphatase 99A [Eurytemora carolleeae]|eukprot:XP_023344200.1 tyrosine-protein phosphatase 99A-like [Eurytemora affinis]
MMCSDPSMELGTCEMIEPQTILGKDTTYATVSNLRPRTSYKLQIRGFTSKREGGDSNPLEVETDTAQPSPPTITVLNCTGKGDILLEWRRPRLYYGKVDYYMVYYRSDKDASFSKRKIDIISNNSSDIYIVYLTGLENDTNYNVAVSAVSVSLHLPGIEFESRLSVNKYVYLNYGCSPVSSSILIYTPSLNLVLVAAGLGALLVIILLVVSTFICRRRISGYGLVAVPPCTAYASGRGRGRGWTGEPESDIPGQLFPKHIQGLHASGDMAICKDYENLETTARQSSRKLYPDIVGGQGLTDRRPVSVDSWLSAGQFILIPGEGALVAGGTWRSIWENQVNLIVTIQTPRTRDDLSQISDSKFFGEYQVQVENETVSPDFLARNMKVRKGRQTRSVDQLLYTQWSERNIRSNLHSFLSFIKSAAASTQTLGGKVLICSRPTDDGGIYYMSLYTMIRQLEDTGDVNLSAYSRNLAESGIILENSSSYANLHDALSFVIDVDFNRNSYSV